MSILMKNNNIFCLFIVYIDVRLIHGVHDSTRFYDKSWGCDLYMDATYTRVITVICFLRGDFVKCGHIDSEVFVINSFWNIVQNRITIIDN